MSYVILNKRTTYPNIYTTIKLYLSFIIYEKKSISELDVQLIIKITFFSKI